MTYTIKVKVTAAGNANYNTLAKTATCKAVVKLRVEMPTETAFDGSPGPRKH